MGVDAVFVSMDVTESVGEVADSVIEVVRVGVVGVVVEVSVIVSVVVVVGSGCLNFSDHVPPYRRSDSP